MDWTDELDDTLKEGIKKGLTAKEIAKKIGHDITRNAVLGRIFRQGWSKEMVKKQSIGQAVRGKKPKQRSIFRIQPEDVIDRIMDLKDLGLTWVEVGETIGVSMATARIWGIQYGGYDPIVRKHFTPEEIDYIIQAYGDHVPVEDMADKLNRSYGVIRQKVLKLQQLGRITTHRDAQRTRLLRRYGAQALQAGTDPSDALHKIAEAKRIAFANAMNEAVKARTYFKQQAIEEMAADIAAGVDRNEAIFKARAKGVTLNEISDCFDITRERVRQICSKQAEIIALQKLVGEDDGT